VNNKHFCLPETTELDVAGPDRFVEVRAIITFIGDKIKLVTVQLLDFYGAKLA
jgi:hypothetical protein